MAFTIVAELPLGTYRGAAADGGVERIPSVSRLYSALLCAAGFGPRATATGAGGLMTPCPADEAALHWLETNPPDRVSVPALLVNTGSVQAYRDDGTIKKTRTSMTIKKLAKSPDVSVAVEGAFSWTWSQDPPAEVVAALSALASDVPYLGTTESPVRLSVHQGGPAPVDAAGGTVLVLDPDAGIFAGAGGEDVEHPLPGRLAELADAHVRVNDRSPSAAKDRWTSDETSVAPVPPRNATAVARYRPLAPVVADVPWPHCLMLPLGRFVREIDRVRVAVNVHRALIAVIGHGAPPLLTGVYPEGAAPPVNRLAIQVVDASMPVDLRGHEAALAFLVPPDPTEPELDAVQTAISSLEYVAGPGGSRYRIPAAPWAVDGARFWHESPVGMVRTWRTAPPAVPEVRGLRDRPWTFAHTALLSLGFVWRRHLPAVPGRGDERYAGLVDAVNGAGAAVMSAAPLRETDVRPYSHKVHEHAVVRPYRARLWLGDLGSTTTVQAIGQTRHLGGGLLVPVDAPAGTPVTVPAAAGHAGGGR